MFFALDVSQAAGSSHFANAVFGTVVLTVTPQGTTRRGES